MALRAGYYGVKRRIKDKIEEIVAAWDNLVTSVSTLTTDISELTSRVGSLENYTNDVEVVEIPAPEGASYSAYKCFSYKCNGMVQLFGFFTASANIAANTPLFGIPASFVNTTEADIRRPIMYVGGSLALATLGANSISCRSAISSGQTVVFYTVYMASHTPSNSRNTILDTSAETVDEPTTKKRTTKKSTAKAETSKEV